MSELLERIQGHFTIHRSQQQNYPWPESRYMFQWNPWCEMQLASGKKLKTHWNYVSGEGPTLAKALEDALWQLSRSRERPSFREPLLDELYPVEKLSAR